LLAVSDFYLEKHTNLIHDSTLIISPYNSKDVNATHDTKDQIGKRLEIIDENQEDVEDRSNDGEPEVREDSAERLKESVIPEFTKVSSLIKQEPSIDRTNTITRTLTSQESDTNSDIHDTTEKLVVPNVDVT